MHGASARRARRRPASWLLLVLIVVGVLAGCGGDRAPRSGTPPAAVTDVPELDVTATSGYGRHATVRAKADVRLVNDGTAEVRFATLQVRHPLFEELAPVSRRTVLAPDGEVNLVPVPLGAPRCDRDDPAGATLRVGVDTPDGVSDVDLPLVDSEPGLVRAHRLACATAAVEGLVTLDLRTDGTRRAVAEGTGLVVSLHLQRKGPGAVAVTELSGNILFSVAGRPPVPLVQLAADADTAQADVVLLAGRCDRHALIESKTSFTFPLFAAIDDGEPARLTTTATGPARGALQSLLDDTCGATGEPSTSP